MNIEEKETEKVNRRLRPEAIGLCNGITSELGNSISLWIDREIEQQLDDLKQVRGEKFNYMCGYISGLAKAEGIVINTITNTSTRGLLEDVLNKMKESRND